jgi:hypothetical protein
MKQLLLCVMALGFFGCRENHIENWERPLVYKWANDMGEKMPNYTCYEFFSTVASYDQAYCSIRVGERVYKVNCYYGKQACIQQIE